MSRSQDSRSGSLRFLPAATVPHGDRRNRKRWFFAVLLTGVSLTGLLFFVLSRSATRKAQDEFKREANQFEAKLQSQFDLAIEYLLAIPPFFQASEEVSEDEFRAFVEDAIQRHPGVYTFEYLERVRKEDLKEFEAKKRRDLGRPSFAVSAVNREGAKVALPDNDVYFPISFGEPLIEEVLGIDLASHPEQGTYVKDAMRSDGAIATPPISLIENPDNRGFLIALDPHYLPQVQGECVGIAVLIVEIAPVVEAAFSGWREEELHFALIDADADKDHRVIYANASESQVRSPGHGLPTKSSSITFADQQWEFLVAPSSASEYAKLPYWIFLPGLALSALAAYSLSATLKIGGLKEQVDAAIELGQYRLGRKLGSGGMGEVYEAQHRMLARPAAIKLIQLEEDPKDPDTSSKQAMRLARFEREAKATARLESPHTINVYDFGQTPDDKFYYVMELLRGQDLSKLVKEFGPISTGRMIYLVRQVCDSLAEAHAAGLIHRDIKPANIFVCRYGLEYDFVKVLDFGIVKSIDAEPDLEVTLPGSFVGTPAFVAPEMLLSKELDGRTDLYSLGCVMYWLLTGKAPFKASTATAMFAKQLTEKPRSLRAGQTGNISEKIDNIVLSCLAKDPADRPGSASELGRLLAACADDHPWTQTDAIACWQREAGQHQASLGPSAGEISDPNRLHDAP